MTLPYRRHVANFIPVILPHAIIEFVGKLTAESILDAFFNPAAVIDSIRAAEDTTSIDTHCWVAEHAPIVVVIYTESIDFDSCLYPALSPPSILITLLIKLIHVRAL